MKPRLLLVAACCLLATWVFAQDEQPPAADGPAAVEGNQVVRHLVLFKFKKGVAEEKIHEIESAFADLENKIDTVADLEWGTDSSPEGLAKGYTHCFLVTFNSPADRDAYLPHPAHQEFVAILRPHLDEALVLDYTPEK